VGFSMGVLWLGASRDSCYTDDQKIGDSGEETMSTTIQVAQRGVITLPKSLRDAYNIKTGDVFTVIDLGEGAFLLSRERSSVEDLLDNIRTGFEESGESLESMLRRLRAKREQTRVESANT
jgi:bifunctional DNA-binding transcriptional regulator/antitoxin component of YhaV-PrlF toxin-antitoxin module